MPLESPIVGGSGGGGGSLPQPLDTTDSPTFAGLTLTSFSGIVRAASGVLSAGWYTAEQTNPATIGFVRASNATTIVAARNSTNTGDWTILSTTTKIVLGAASGPAISVLSGANITFGDAGTFVTVNVNGITLEGNDSTALYGGDNSGNPYKLVSAVDQGIWIGDNVGSVVANCADACGFIVANNGVNTCTIMLDGESFHIFDSGYNATIKIADNISGSGNNLTLRAASSGGSNGNGGDLIHEAGEKNGSGTHGRQVFHVGGQERGSLQDQGWCQWGSIWTLKKAVSLIGGVGTTDTLICELPGKFLLQKALMRLSAAITGSGTVVVRLGSTSGGNELLLDTETLNSGSTLDTVWGQEPAVDCGSAMLPEQDYCGLFIAGESIYFRHVIATASTTAGEMTITLMGIEL